jgi:para-nitrobenzyl esterase
MDGVVIPDWPAALFDEGRFHPVPLLLGTNADEGTIFTMPGARRARGQFAAELAASYGPLATRLLELYPVAEQENAGPASAAIFGDSVFVAPSRAQARAVADASVPCFLYQFTRVVGGRLRNALGAFHAAEIPYVFGNLGSGGFQRYEPADAALATTMQDCWIAFARSGDPNGEGRPAWPAYDAEEDSHLELDVTIRVGAGLRAAQCDFWDELLSAAVRRGR